MDAGAAINAERVTRYVAGRVALRPMSATTSTPRAMPIFSSMRKTPGGGSGAAESTELVREESTPKTQRTARAKVLPRAPFSCDAAPVLESLPERVGRRSETDVALIG